MEGNNKDWGSNETETKRRVSKINEMKVNLWKMKLRSVWIDSPKGERQTEDSNLKKRNERGVLFYCAFKSLHVLLPLPGITSFPLFYCWTPQLSAVISTESFPGHAQEKLALLPYLHFNGAFPNSQYSACNIDIPTDVYSLFASFISKACIFISLD